MTRIIGRAIERYREGARINFVPNYDDSLTEPDASPLKSSKSTFITALVVLQFGMATNIPPHRLDELIDGLVALARESRYR